MIEIIEPWRHAFREGFAPGMSDAALTALAKGLREDDPNLVQGDTTRPVAYSGFNESTVCQGACAIGYGGLKGDGYATIEGVWRYFGERCAETDAVLGLRQCAHFLNWFDRTPRHQMRPQLLAEVESILAQRAQQSNDAGAA